MYLYYAREGDIFNVFCKYGCRVVFTPEYTQSGNGHFLAYFHHEKLALAGEGVHAHPLSLQYNYHCMLQLKGQMSFPYIVSIPVCTLWFVQYVSNMSRNNDTLARQGAHNTLFYKNGL
jgi:hypothetical protein